MTYEYETRADDLEQIEAAKGDAETGLKEVIAASVADLYDYTSEDAEALSEEVAANVIRWLIANATNLTEGDASSADAFEALLVRAAELSEVDLYGEQEYEPEYELPALGIAYVDLTGAVGVTNLLTELNTMFAGRILPVDGPKVPRRPELRVVATELEVEYLRAIGLNPKVEEIVVDETISGWEVGVDSPPDA